MRRSMRHLSLAAAALLGLGALSAPALAQEADTIVDEDLVWVEGHYGVDGEWIEGYWRDQSRDGFERFVEAVRHLARDYGLFYAEVYETMAREPDGTLASDDYVHPNDEGHRVIAAAFAAAVKV